MDRRIICFLAAILLLCASVAWGRMSMMVTGGGVAVSGGGTTITNVGNWADTTSSESNSITVSGIQKNDFVILYAINDAGSGPGINWPSGFTERATASITVDSARMAVATKFAAGGETSFAMGTSDSSFISGCSVFRGVNTTTPLDVTTVTAVTDVSMGSPFTASGSITPITNSNMLVAITGWDTTGSVGAISNSFSGGGLSWSSGYSVDQSGGGFRHMGSGYATQATAASITVTGTGTVSGGSAGRAIVLLSLRP